MSEITLKVYCGHHTRVSLVSDGDQGECGWSGQVQADAEEWAEGITPSVTCPDCGATLGRDDMTYIDFIGENRQWIADWRGGTFSSTSRDAEGWPIEMHGLVESLEKALDALASERAAREQAEQALRAFEVIALNGVVCTPPDTWDEDEGTGLLLDVEAMRCGECKAAWRKLRAALAASGGTGQ